MESFKLEIKIEENYFIVMILIFVIFSMSLIVQPLKSFIMIF